MRFFERVSRGMAVCAMQVVLFLLTSIAGLSQQDIPALRRAVDTATADSTRIRLMLDLGALLETAQPDSALAVYERCSEIASRTGDARSQARCLLFSGIVLADKGEYARSIVFYERALPWYRKANDRKGEAAAVNNIGNSYNYMGNFRKAVENYLAAKPLMEEIGDAYSLCALTGNLADCYRQLKEPTSMLATAREAYDLAGQTGDSTEIANAGITLGTAFSLNGQADTALVLLRRSLDLGTRLNDPAIRFYASYDIADQLLKSGKAKDAMSAADSTLQYALLTQRNYNLIGAHLLRGKCLSVLKKKKPAQESFELAMSLADQDSAGAQLLDALRLLADHYEGEGNFRQALEFRNRWIVLNDSIYSANNARQMAEMRTLYETAEKDRIITRERLANAQSADKIHKQQLTMYLGGAGVICLLLVLLFVIRTLSQRRQMAQKAAELEKQKNVALELEQDLLRKQQENLKKEQESIKLRALIQGQEQERFRLGRELHDGLGGMLTAARLQLDQLAREAGNALPVEKYMGLQNLITRAGHELREVSHDLSPEGLTRLGLVEMMEQYCRRITTDATRVTFEHYGQPVALSAEREVMVYRLVQELLNNTLKHAGASDAFVTLTYGESSLTLVAEDNGRGFDVRAEIGKGKGLQTIVSRVTYLRGELDVMSTSGKGTSYTIIIPIQSAAT
ncbi:MAG: tetratricopeptide repeat protein [Flavobacteriales bacterium]|nr:tetratricopeptide repeat protein [Flavobacteriales bacterium]